MWKMLVIGPLVAAPLFADVAGATDFSRWYAGKAAPLRRGLTVHICHGTNCSQSSRVALSSKELRTIAGRLASRAASAAAERKALSEAVARYEKLVGPRAGTQDDQPGIRGWASHGQIDCIGDATNTTSLLVLLKKQGYLRFHEERAPVSRGSFLDGRYPHSTAVIAEAGGEEWSIDSWPRANGEPPVIMPMSRWRKERSAMLD